MTDSRTGVVPVPCPWCDKVNDAAIAHGRAEEKPPGVGDVRIWRGGDR